MTKEQRVSSFQKVEALANAKGVSLYKVAKELGFPRALFSDWKSGKSMPKTDKLIKLSNYFGVAVGYFLE